MSALAVTDVGPQVLVQDAGRTGLAGIGVGRSGAADRAAYTLGGRLVAHGAGRACLEVAFGGLVATVHGEATIALTGADAHATVDGHPIPHSAPLQVRDGQELRLGMPSAGVRTYLSVRGGFDVPQVLGSRSTDTLAALGPDAVSAGDVLPVADFDGPFPNVDVAPVALPATGRVTLFVLPGPRRDWFADMDSVVVGGPTADSTQSHSSADGGAGWTVSERSNRVGVRLTGTALERRHEHRERELPSEGMMRGCIQVPPDGQPVIFGSDHPVTGGYPVIGVLTAAAADRAAQLQPGQQVDLRWAK
ncbi:MAG: biotin-dependent carboxyltransferase family protein [Ornithinimicrobium sp.]